MRYGDIEIAVRFPVLGIGRRDAALIIAGKAPLDFAPGLIRPHPLPRLSGTCADVARRVALVVLLERPLRNGAIQLREETGRYTNDA